MSYGGQPGDQYGIMRGGPQNQPGPGMQQRMMMGPGGPGGPNGGAIPQQRATGPQATMYAAGPNPAMIPQQNMHIQQPTYHMPQRSQQISHQALTTMFNQLPMHQQQEISACGDTNRKSMLIQQYFHQQQQHRQRMQMGMRSMPPVQAGPGNMIRSMPPGYPNGIAQQPVGQMSQMVVTQPSMQQQPGMMHRVPSSSSMMSASPMSMSQGSVSMSGGTPMAVIQPGTPQQQPIQQQVGPNTAVSSPKVGSLQVGQAVNATSPATQIVGQSPVANTQPKTPGQGQPATNTPGSTGNAGGGPGSQQQAMSDEESKIYKEKINEMNRKYRDSLMRILDRAKLDREQPPAGLEKAIEIWDEKRQVTLEFLDRLHASIQKLIEKHTPTFFIVEAIRQRNMAQANGSPTTSGEMVEEKRETKRSLENATDPWAAVKHLRIKVPDRVRAIYKKEVLPSKKRKAEEIVEESSDIKRQRTTLEGETHDVKNYSITQSNALKVFPVSQFHSAYQETAGSVPCLFDSSKSWKLPDEAIRELSATNARWAVEKRPPCKETPDVQLCIESEQLLTCPLRVLLPLGYPSLGPQVLFAESFPPSVPLSASLETLFRRRLAIQNDKSLTSIILSWRAACELQVASSRAPSMGSVSFPAPPKQLVA